MSTTQFRIREFEAANHRFAAAKGKVAREQEELEFQEKEVREARSRLEVLEKRLKEQELRVKSDRKKLEEAELNLKEVEDRWQVHDVDEGSHVTNSNPTKSTVNANAVEDVIDIASPCPVRTNSSNRSDDSLSNANDDANSLVLVTNIGNDDCPTSNATEHNIITSDEDDSGSDDDDSINETSSAPGNATVNANDDCHTTSAIVQNVVSSNNAEPKSAFLFENIVVEGCGVPGTNGQFDPVTVRSNGDQVYWKAGDYRGEASMFELCHCQSRSHWTLVALCRGRISNLYTSKSRDEFKNEVPRRDEWVVNENGVPPLPAVTGQKNNLALSSKKD